MKKTTKNNTEVPEVEAVTSTADLPKKTGDELEVEQLRYLMDEMEKRGIHDLGTLGVILERLERKIQSH